MTGGGGWIVAPGALDLGHWSFVPGHSPTGSSHWKLVTLQNREEDLKFEFNRNNRDLYCATNVGLGQAPV